MKGIVIMAMALAFALGISGFSVAAEKDMPGMNHGDAKVCANVNCCGNQAKTTVKGSESKKADDQKLEKVYDIKPSDG